MEITKVNTNKKKYLDLLLAADEQEDMIDRYLDRGIMYILEDDGVKAECVITYENDDVLEIKNIAVTPEFRKKGYGKTMIDFISSEYSGQFSFLRAGTGDSPQTTEFYEKCGFKRSHRIKNFFTDNYSRPIYDGGVLLKDMVYFQKKL